METLQARATEGSTYKVTCTFTDDTGAAVTPDSNVVWTVRRTDGTQVSTGNESAAATVNVVIKGADLSAAGTTEDEELLTLILETTYTSALGSGLPLVKIVKFAIDNELGVP